MDKRMENYMGAGNVRVYRDNFQCRGARLLVHL